MINKISTPLGNLIISNYCFITILRQLYCKKIEILAIYIILGMIILYSGLQKNVDVIPAKVNNSCTLFRFRIIRYSLYLILAKHCTLLLASGLARLQQSNIDPYFQLWEQSQMDNSRLRDDLAKTRDELSAAKKKIETVVQVIYSF